MDVTLDSKDHMKYLRESRVCIAVINVDYFLPCIDELYPDDIGNHLIYYLDSVEDVEYMGFYMRPTGDNIYVEDSCDRVLAFTQC